MPTADEIVKALEQCQMVPAEELQVWKRELGRYRGRAVPGDTTAAQETRLLDHAVMKQLDEVARFRMRRRDATSSQCLAWVRKELDDLGVAWGDWLWMLSQQVHDPDVKDRVEHLAAVVCGSVR